jgi:hypothetical protein
MKRKVFIRLGSQLLMAAAWVAGCLLFGSLRVVAQDAVPDSLTRQFERYQAKAFQEKLFVHTDRTFYLAGEVIWFSVYDVDAATNRLRRGTNVAYVEVLDRDNKPLLQARIAMQDGSGSGSFKIPASSRSGNFVLRAYTNWMRNFSPEYYFYAPLTIVNTLNEDSLTGDSEANEGKPGAPSGMSGEAGRAGGNGGAGGGGGDGSYDVRWFPEGGNLVSGLASVVGYKAADGSGHGLDCEGVVVDSRRDTVARFRSGPFGMGSFLFKPQTGEKYQALVRVRDSVVKRPLPEAHDEGYVLHLEDAGDGRLKVDVLSKGRKTDPAVYLFVQNHQVVRAVMTGKPVAGAEGNAETVFFVDKKGLGEGITQFTVFNSDRSPVCERLFCRLPGEDMRISVHAGAPSAIAGGPPQEIATRHPMQVGLTVTDPSGKPLKAVLSMSVFYADSLEDGSNDNIAGYLSLGSDLRGRIESPGYYFEHPGQDGAKALDDLMLTQMSSRIRWEDVFAVKKENVEFLPEVHGQVLHGKIVDIRTGQPAAGVMGYLSVPGKDFKTMIAQSGAGGDVYFNLPDYFGNSEMIAMTNARADSNYRIEFNPLFSDRYAAFPVAADLPGRWDEQLRMRSINAQVENSYRIGEKRQFVTPGRRDTSDFFGNQQLEFYLDDYTRFVTMEEVVKEFVLDARIRKQAGKYYFRVRNALFNEFFEEDPLLLLDGVPVFDADKLVNMDPLKIQKITVVSHRFNMGPLTVDGVVSCKTYQGDLAGYQLDPNAIALPFAGLQQQREFYSPVYDTKEKAESRIPDFRSELCWSPDIRTDGQGHADIRFYTSDLKGTFIVFVQGISEDGVAGSVVAKVRVGE